MPVPLDVLAANQVAPTPPMDFVAHRLGFHVMSKPIGPICNLDCAYCFYLEKEAL
jgi:sulfatase maturation enzyme AslB (radical SAM superfamily)